MGNLNSAKGLDSGSDVGDTRGNPTFGVFGVVEVPECRPLILLSGGYDAWNRGDGCELGNLGVVAK